jgi:ectoine hydroxylase-related dioxygenase (phytanoyl-CoA dioxygenase family)
MSFAIAERESLAAAVETAGWAVTPPVVPQLTLDVLVDMLSPLARGGGGGAGRAGVRNLFETAPAVRALASSSAVRAVAEAVLGPHCFAVRALLFDKTAEANWKVVWHQDLTIAVREPARVPGYGPWSEKAGIPHVQPPIELLERMLAVRVHLDDCGMGNGPVRVLDGSHRVGRLSPEAIDQWRAHRAPVECLVERGGILACRPLLLHASAPAASPAHRRVIHFEFAAEELPPPLEWHARIA